MVETLVLRETYKVLLTGPLGLILAALTVAYVGVFILQYPASASLSQGFLTLQGNAWVGTRETICIYGTCIHIYIYRYMLLMHVCFHIPYTVYVYPHVYISYIYIYICIFGMYMLI